MKTSFLDYYKIILEKVSFDQQLLRREYRKALAVLTNKEQSDLRFWLNKKGFFSESKKQEELFLQAEGKPEMRSNQSS